MLEKMATFNSVVVYLLLFLVAIVGTYILISLSNAGKKMSQNNSSKKSRGGLGCLTVLFLFLVTFSMLFFTAYLRAYHAFDQEELVGYLQCEPVPGNAHSFVLTFTPVIKGKEQTASKYSINGDQWAIGGDIVKWKSFLNFMGLKSMYRLTQVEGQYLRETNSRK